jgi:hypothetical protein
METEVKDKQDSAELYMLPSEEPCVLCGSENSHKIFKGRMVCEDCVDFMQELHLTETNNHLKH